MKHWNESPIKIFPLFNRSLLPTPVHKVPSPDPEKKRRHDSADADDEDEPKRNRIESPPVDFDLNPWPGFLTTTNGQSNYEGIIDRLIVLNVYSSLSLVLNIVIIRLFLRRLSSVDNRPNTKYWCCCSFCNTW